MEWAFTACVLLFPYPFHSFGIPLEQTSAPLTKRLHNTSNIALSPMMFKPPTHLALGFFVRLCNQ